MIAQQLLNRIVVGIQARRAGAIVSTVEDGKFAVAPW